MNINIKTILLITVLVLIIIISGVITLNYLYRSSSKLETNINSAYSAVSKTQWELAENQLKEFETNWKKTKYIWAMLVDHFEIDNIDNSFVKSKQYIESKDYPSALSEVDSLRQYILHIPRKENFSLENIL